MAVRVLLLVTDEAATDSAERVWVLLTMMQWLGGDDERLG